MQLREKLPKRNSHNVGGIQCWAIITLPLNNEHYINIAYMAPTHSVIVSILPI